jgi:hypothetical protein
MYAPRARGALFQQTVRGRELAEDRPLIHPIRRAGGGPAAPEMAWPSLPRDGTLAGCGWLLLRCLQVKWTYDFEAWSDRSMPRCGSPLRAGSLRWNLAQAPAAQGSPWPIDGPTDQGVAPCPSTRLRFPDDGWPPGAGPTCDEKSTPGCAAWILSAGHDD